jgi:hypothetical protein
MGVAPTFAAVVFGCSFFFGLEDCFFDWLLVSGHCLVDWDPAPRWEELQPNGKALAGAQDEWHIHAVC